MFGYVPTGPFDMEEEDTEGKPIRRTKSRAYKIAVWAGPWGAHQFFLNNAPGALVHWLILGTLVGLPSSLGAWPVKSTRVVYQPFDKTSSVTTSRTITS